MSLTNKDRLRIGTTQNVGSFHIGPIPVEEYPREGEEVGQDNFERFQDEEFKREFYSMTARLFGVGGDPGVLDEIRDSLKESLANQRDLKEEVAELKTQLKVEVAQEKSCREKEDTLIRAKIEKLEEDLDAVGEIARSVRDRTGKFWGKVRDAIIPLIVLAVLVLLVLGVQAYLDQGRRIHDPLATPPPVALVEPVKVRKIEKVRILL
ncbi:MAG: hypothetical protein PQJ59_01875 [Spirochaetales bacterium]|nr:hypothetical protein [Spirochaetales bacterium]